MFEPWANDADYERNFVSDSTRMDIHLLRRFGQEFESGTAIERALAKAIDGVLQKFDELLRDNRPPPPDTASPDSAAERQKPSSSGTAPDRVIGTAEAGHSPTVDGSR